MNPTTRAFASTITGRRSRNEDAFLLEQQLGVFAVLDGMGGYEGGQLASSLAVEVIAQFFQATSQNLDATWPYALDVDKSLIENRVEAAIRLANRCIRAQRNEQFSHMGSTIVMLSLCGDQAVLAHLGDSRIYRSRAGVLDQLTCDHSLYEYLRADGVQLPPLEEFVHANVITRALGPHEDERPDLAVVEVEPGDRFLLCSDGLSGVLSDPELLALLDSGSAEQSTEALIAAAFAAGSRDNITAMVVDID